MRRERVRAVTGARRWTTPPPSGPDGGWGCDHAARHGLDDVLEELADDDLLRNVFTCCHPALALDIQVAPALRMPCGLTTAEVARGLLLPEATATKRLTRARQKIALARIPVPGAGRARATAGVAACGYLFFNKGDAARSEDDPGRALTSWRSRSGSGCW